MPVRCGKVSISAVPAKKDEFDAYSNAIFDLRIGHNNDIIVGVILDGRSHIQVQQLVQYYLILFFKGDEGNEIAKLFSISNHVSNMSELDEKILTLLNELISNIDESVLKQLRQYKVQRDQLINKLHCVESDNIGEYTSQLERLERKLASSCTVLLTLISSTRVYYALVGGGHGVLCTTENPMPISLTLVEHTNIVNEVEIARLRRCGLGSDALQWFSIAGRYTRCLGDLRLKEDYQSIDVLSKAHLSPIICTPTVGVKSLNIADCPDQNGQTKYLLLASSGLVRLVHDLIFELDKVDGELVAVFQNVLQKESAAQNVSFEELNLDLVAKEVIHFFDNRYQEQFYLLSDLQTVDCAVSLARREDLGLLIYEITPPLVQLKATADTQPVTETVDMKHSMNLKMSPPTVLGEANEELSNQKVFCKIVPDSASVVSKENACLIKTNETSNSDIDELDNIQDIQKCNPDNNESVHKLNESNNEDDFEDTTPKANAHNCAELSLNVETKSSSDICAESPKLAEKPVKNDDNPGVSQISSYVDFGIWSDAVLTLSTEESEKLTALAHPWLLNGDNTK